MAHYYNLSKQIDQLDGWKKVSKHYTLSWYPVFMVASVCTAIIGATVLVWLVRLEVRNVSWLL